LNLILHWKAVVVCIVIGWMILKGFISFRGGLFSNLFKIFGVALLVLFLLGIAQDIFKGVADQAQHVLSWDWVRQEGNKLLAKKIPPPARALGATLDQADLKLDACLRSVVSNYQLPAITNQACSGKTGVDWQNCMRSSICSREELSTVVIPYHTPCMDAEACQAAKASNSFGPNSGAQQNTIKTYLCDWDMLPDSMCTK